jgi:SAM-dependent methyltransferase
MRDVPAAAPGGQAHRADQADRLRWNARYTGRRPSFAAHPLASRALALPLPDGPVLDLACGPSGSALLAAEHGRAVTAVDVSDVALAQLEGEALRRGLNITVVRAGLSAWRPAMPYALVLCTGFWDRTVFEAAAGAVTPSGVLAWEALTGESHRGRPEWRLSPGEPAVLLPPGFTILDQYDVPGARRHLLARAPAHPGTAIGVADSAGAGFVRGFLP